MANHHGCPVQATSNVIAGKWKVLIVWHLAFGAKRFAELRDRLPGVSEKVLTAQLKDLERDGVILRISAHSQPPRVDYMLTKAGEDLVRVMDAMCAWGSKYLGVEPTLTGRPPLLSSENALADTHRGESSNPQGI
jgi:DNA-binding HxlR family transcriptional regulator